jgi:hypothetical protein
MKEASSSAVQCYMLSRPVLQKGPADEFSRVPRLERNNRFVVWIAAQPRAVMVRFVPNKWPRFPRMLDRDPILLTVRLSRDPNQRPKSLDRSPLTYIATDVKTSSPTDDTQFQCHEEPPPTPGLGRPFRSTFASAAPPPTRLLHLHPRPLRPQPLGLRPRPFHLGCGAGAGGDAATDEAVQRRM